MESSNILDRTIFQYFEKNLLHESPFLIDAIDSDEVINKQLIKAKVFDQKEKFEDISDIYNRNDSVVLFDKNKGFTYLFIKKSGNLVAYSRIIYLDDGGILSQEIYNHPLFKGFIRQLFFNFYLKRFPYIMSSDIQTEDGKTFWENILYEGKRLGKKLYVCFVGNDDNILEIEPINDLDSIEQYYSTEDMQYENFRFIISNSEI